MEQLTKDWSESWREKKELLEKYSVDVNRDQAGFLINSLQPYLVSLDRDVLSTGVVFYHLRVRLCPPDAFKNAGVFVFGFIPTVFWLRCSVFRCKCSIIHVCLTAMLHINTICSPFYLLYCFFFQLSSFWFAIPL